MPTDKHTTLNGYSVGRIYIVELRLADGGGVRGFASLLLLEALMREIARVEKDELLLNSILSDIPGADTTPAPSSFYPFETSLSSKEAESLPYLPCHYFDFVAGSGTGGDAYAGNRDIVPLTSDKDICKTIVVARGRFGASPDKKHIFRSYGHYPDKETGNAPLNPGPSCDASLWEVGHATMAAPTYFEKKKLRKWTFKNGGMRASNPTEDVVHEVRLLAPMQPPTVVVSIGTGTRHHTSTGNGGVANTFAPFTGLLAAIRDTEKVSRKVEKQLGRGSSYFRFNDRSAEWNWVLMDQWIPGYEGERKQKPGQKTLEKMQCIVEKYLKDGGQEEMERCAEQLVKLRRRRLFADPDRWERFALVSTFHCPSCPNVDTFTSRAGFERHIERNHEAAELNIDQYKYSWSYQGQRRSSWYIP
ncbi:hypothetical protein ZTR_03872 [Talaromyces verruculosus]|nr:hypothetical protein ZTR_03872 [Talaromyces verruculosus]